MFLSRFTVYLTFHTTCLTLCFSLLTEADAGHTEFMDEVFQNETRFPGGEWKSASEPFTDVVRTRPVQMKALNITHS